MAIDLRVRIGTNVREYHFDRSDIVIGCHPFNDIVIQNLASKHGRFALGAAALTYEDLGTELGTEVVRAGHAETIHSSQVTVNTGELVRFGDQVSVEILAIKTCCDAAGPCIPIPTSKADALLGSLEPDLAAVVLGAASGLLVADTLCQTSCVLQKLVEKISPDTRAYLVVPNGQDALKSRVVPCRRQASSEWQLPDPEQLVTKMRDGRFLQVVERANAWCVYAPFAEFSEGEDLPGYLRLHFKEEPSTELLKTVATVTSVLRPVLLRLLHTEEMAQKLEQLRAETRYFRARARRHYLFKELAGQSPAMRSLYAEMEPMLESDSPVLVLGEAGSGKKMIGRALHHLGNRKHGMFISVNCGVLAPETLDVELFGLAADESGQLAHKGLFELADSGTLFLDEIDRSPWQVQTKLVRAIREREVRRLGDEVGRTVEVRVVAGTHADLDAMCRRGEFRRDLLTLLMRTKLTVPPLRARRDDILPMAEHFMRKYSRRYGLQVHALSKDAAAALNAHDWAGNVRELQVVIETAVMRAKTGELEPHHLHFVPKGAPGEAS